MRIVAHTLVKNEEKWIWYSLMSVLNYIDEIFVWDAGSTDRTVDIVKTISSPKIKFKEIGNVDEKPFTTARQNMLDETKADWVLIVDGDEIWPKEAIFQTVSALKEKDPEVEFLVSKYINLVGDVYHYQEPLASHYRIGKYYGNFTIRAVSLTAIPGLHFGNPYGSEGFFDSANMPIQDRVPFKAKLISTPYLHTTHLARSSKDNSVMQRKPKFKYELGISLASDFSYPPCFYIPRPKAVSPPWEKQSFSYSLNAAWQTPIKYIQRRIK
ncbi:MAG: glycosyltransferase [Patescibacteria group bacterium]